MINRIEKQEEVDRRIFERIPVDFPLRLKNNAQDKESNGYCWDVSANGVGLFSKEKLGRNDRLEMWLELPQKYNPLHLSGEVVWVREAQPQIWRVGIQLLKTHLMDLSLVMRLAQETKK